jgi:hypothetical protein
MIKFLKQLFCRHEYLYQGHQKISDIMIKPSFWGMKAGFIGLQDYQIQLQEYGSVIHKETCAKCGTKKESKCFNPEFHQK